ncbi:Hypothetical predicted protein [Pelobates cultripes]|uniref:Uncharacterized protein n=1 Tax=Pelobates cultripes TaxID=61616 RepID=A0AAD1WRD2_PELCU|nr:Hypothetical predicted protein [Pelobates cultripes]
MVPSGRKATSKSHHLISTASKTSMTGRLHPVETEDVVLPRKRAPHQAKAVRNWKRAKALPDLSDSDSDSEEVSDRSDAIDPVYSEDSSPERSEAAPPAVEAEQEADKSAILDPQGKPLFDPDALHNPCSAYWYPTTHVAIYIANRVRKTLDKATRSKLRAECPRPTRSQTWPRDPRSGSQDSFLVKPGWKAKKGLDYSLRNCQDKVLDILWPIAKIFETALTEGTPIDLLAIRGWIQSGICLIGNTNTAFATEQRKAILIKN